MQSWNRAPEEKCQSRRLVTHPKRGTDGRQGLCRKWFELNSKKPWASFVVQLVKNLPAMRETWVRSLGWDNPLEKGKATHSSILAWRIPWSIQSVGSQRVGHKWATFTFKDIRVLAQSCLTLCDPMDCSPPGSSVHGISQARILERIAISFSRGSSWPRDWICISSISCIGRHIL